ncbi:MAG: hypothetical protein HY290_17935 [Planctomycetia bacterium]|nr:hypothetical protein [Planctomycetia bacterium]
MESPLADREKYRPSGHVSPEFFILAMPLAVVASLLAGGIMFGIFRFGFYFFLIIPLLAAMIPAGAFVFAVRVGRCRNRVIAAVFGVFAGLLAYGSYYYFDMLDMRGVDQVLRIDAVPSHIWFRLQTDRVEAHPGINHRNDPPTPWANYIFFTIDGLLICGLIAGVAGERAGRIYCEHSDWWATYHMRSLAPEAGAQIVSALAAGRLDECLAGLHVLPPRIDQHQQPHCQLILEVCAETDKAESQEVAGCCAFLSLREMLFQSKQKRSKFSLGLEKLLSQVPLTADEYRKFQSKFLVADPIADKARVRTIWLRVLIAVLAIAILGVVVYLHNAFLG